MQKAAIFSGPKHSGGIGLYTVKVWYHIVARKLCITLTLIYSHNMLLCKIGTLDPCISVSIKTISII